MGSAPSVSMAIYDCAVPARAAFDRIRATVGLDEIGKGAARSWVGSAPTTVITPTQRLGQVADLAPGTLQRERPFGITEWVR